MLYCFVAVKGAGWSRQLVTRRFSRWMRMTAVTVAGPIADGSGPLTRRFACTRDALAPNGGRCEADQPMEAPNVPADAVAVRSCRSQLRMGDSHVSASRLLFGVVTHPAICPVIGEGCIALSDDAGVRTMWLPAWRAFRAYSHRGAPCRGKAGRPDHAEPLRAKRHDPLVPQP